MNRIGTVSLLRVNLVKFSLQKPWPTAIRSMSSPSPPPAKRVRSRSPPPTLTLQELPPPELEMLQKEPNTFKEEQRKARDLARRVKNKRKDYNQMLLKTGREPIEFDIEEMIGKTLSDSIQDQSREFEPKFERDSQLELEVERLDSHGNGLAKASSNDWVISIPGALPGEKVIAQVMSNERMYSRAKLVQLLQPNPEIRHDELVGCKYFGACGGCQYQMLTYEKQLDLKRQVVERAFANYSGLEKTLVPEVLPTMPSPLQYNYRTKLTPHFDLPPELRKKRRAHNKGQATADVAAISEFPIGFDCVGTKKVMDIEECPIATRTINHALPRERKHVKDNIHTFKNGATILLRDSLNTYESVAEDQLAMMDVSSDSTVQPDTVVVTNHKATVKERVGEIMFESPAGTFFQNNRSILPSLLDCVRQQILATAKEGEERYLVDAYCGSGLFSLCLASLFTQVSGVEISSESIKYAEKNANLNQITNAKFLAGNAEQIFAEIKYPAEKTTVIIDPPRRGCDEVFIDQLVKLGPAHIIYVSCNVHTQARDVGQLLTKAPQYEILSVRGADLFPQTHHVEGVCILRKK